MLVENLKTVEANHIKGDIAAANNDWIGAVTHYENAVTGLLKDNDAIPASSKPLILKTATAALNAGRRKTLVALIEKMQSRRSDELSVEFLSSVMSLIDSEPGFTEFSAAYKAFFSDAAR